MFLGADVADSIQKSGENTFVDPEEASREQSVVDFWLGGRVTILRGYGPDFRTQTARTSLRETFALGLTKPQSHVVFGSATIFASPHNNGQQAIHLDKIAALEHENEDKALQRLRIWKAPTLSRTIAGLEGAQSIEMHHVAEAINYRAFDRKLFG